MWVLYIKKKLFEHVFCCASVETKLLTVSVIEKQNIYVKRSKKGEQQKNKYSKKWSDLLNLYDLLSIGYNKMCLYV